MKILIIFISGCEIFDDVSYRFRESKSQMKNERFFARGGQLFD